MLRLIIGNKVYSSWSLRGWLAVRQSGLPFEEVVVPLYDENWEARKMEPDLAPSAGKVPTLWDGDIAVWDSLAIIDYLDARAGDARFWPRDPARPLHGSGDARWLYAAAARAQHEPAPFYRIDRTERGR